MPLHDLSLTDFETGQILLIDKPLHWSSYQAVNAVKWGIKTKFNIKSIGYNFKIATFLFF